MARETDIVLENIGPTPNRGGWDTVNSVSSDYIEGGNPVEAKEIDIQLAVDEMIGSGMSPASCISDILIKDRSHNGTIITDRDVAHLFDLIEKYELKPEDILGINHLLKRELVGIGSIEDIGEDDPARQNARLGAFKIAQGIIGDALVWQEKQMRGQQLPEYAEILVGDKKELVFLCLHEALSGLGDSVGDRGIGGDDTLEPERLFRNQIDRIRDYAVTGVAEGLVQSAKLSEILEEYTGQKGNLKSLLDQEGRYKDTALESMTEYIMTVSDLTSEQIIEANEVLGTVNFGRYSANQIAEMLEIMRQNPSDDSRDIDNDGFRTVSVVLSGKTGDYNGRFSTGIRNLDSSGVLAFEVETKEDIRKVVWVLRLRGIKPNRVTVMGHGGYHGVDISNSYFLPNRLAKSESESVSST